jgi:hypothetical protein
MMKSLLLVLMLAVLVGCGAPAPESEEPVTTDEAVTETPMADELDVDQEEESESPPEGALRLEEILAKLDAEGITDVVDTDFRGGMWEIEYMDDGEERELRVDPMTGEIFPVEPEESDAS